MYIITQTSLFDNEEIEILGDLERLKLAIENIPDEKIVKKLKKIRQRYLSLFLCIDWFLQSFF